MTPFGLIAAPFVLALLVVVASGEKVIAALAARKARQPISGDAPAAHQVKQGTPTMGGLLILAAMAVSLLAVFMGLGKFMPTERKLRLFAVILTCMFAGLIGLMDDLGKARKKLNKAGLSERVKLGLQITVACGFVGFLALTAHAGTTTCITIAGRDFDLGPVYYFLAVLYLCFFGNAVNFTDGLDGLNSGTTVIVALTLGATIGMWAPEIGFFYGALAGACAGFLVFNAYPARVFMGDTGSLAIGMGLAAAALAAKQELLILIVGLVYVAEIGSMMLQRYVFKYRRIRFGIDYAKAHRVFRRAPLHHHFEELGWPETQVVARFYVASLIAAAIGILLLPRLTSLPMPILSSSGAPSPSATPSAGPVQ